MPNAGSSKSAIENLKIILVYFTAPFALGSVSFEIIYRRRLKINLYAHLINTKCQKGILTHSKVVSRNGKYWKNRSENSLSKGSSERGITKIFVRNFAPIIFLQFFAYLILTPLCKYLAELGCPRRKSCFCWSTAPIASHYGGLEYCRWFYCTRPLVPTEWHSIYWCFTGHINPLWGLISPSD